MSSKSDLMGWVLEALEARGGNGTVVDVSREIWQRHEADLRASGDLFFTWQYDVRWAAQKLRDAGVLKQSSETAGRAWELA